MRSKRSRGGSCQQRDARNVAAVTDSDLDRPYAPRPVRHVILVIGILAASASVAVAHNTRYAWTTTKAQVVLEYEATIALPPSLKASLTEELEIQLAQFKLLALTAQDERKDWLAAGTYANYIMRFRQALAKVRAGLSIDTAECAGTGKVLSGKRYKHFRCAATSAVLEVPDVELRVLVEGALPEVVEGPIRRIGPLEAVFGVHVTGKARMLSQRAS